MTEIWKDIVYNGESYNGYQVSDCGSIKSLNYHRSGKEKIMKCWKDRYGYYKIGLWKNGKQDFLFVHRLVAEAFIPNPENKPTVDHKDRNTLNNNKSNLRWADSEIQNNNRDLSKMLKPVLQYTLDGEFIREWESTREIERQLGFNHSGICMCCNGKLKKSYNFIWKWK